jgi:hypothetical protein
MIEAGLESDEKTYHACHCGMCLRMSGGPVMAVSVGKNVKITGEDNITAYDSTPWMQRGFCKRCGTKVFYRVKETGDLHIPVWLFEKHEDFKFGSQIFIDRKPASYEFANQTPTMTEAEFQKKYS